MATITVTTGTDTVDAGDGVTSLREAVAQANASAGDDTIVFAAGLDAAPLILTQGQLDLTDLSGTSDKVTIDGDIDGDGRADIVLQAGSNARIADVSNNDVTFTGLTLTGGNVAGAGGAIFGSGGDTRITLEAAIVTGNAATGSGGALYAGGGQITVIDSTLSDNTASFGGAIADSYSAGIVISGSTLSGNSAGAGGAIYTGSSLSITTSTLANNTATTGNAGGIYARFSTVNLTNTTLTNNVAADTGGAVNNFFSTVTVTNTLSLGNSASSGAEIFGTFTNAGGSLIGGVAANTVFAQTGGPAGGGLLADNGGPVQTVALLDSATNAALDAGIDANAPAQDARGFDTGFDLPGVPNSGGNTSDIGAYELVTELVVDTTVDEDDGDYSAGDLSLREALTLLNDGGSITFANGSGEAFAGGGTIVLTEGQLNITKDVSILGAGDVTLDGNADGRILEFYAGVTADVSGMTLTNGKLPNTADPRLFAGTAARVNNNADVTMTDMTIASNDGYGGALFVDGAGSLSAFSSTVVDNAGNGQFGIGGLKNFGTFYGRNMTFTDNAGNNGGAISTANSLTLVNSTITGNRAISEGGGIRVPNASSVTLTNTIVVGNTASTGADLAGAVVDGGGNILGGVAAADVFAAIDPNTGGGLLADNGGPVQTIALKDDLSNPALDAGVDTAAPATDATGNARFDVAGLANNGGNISDSGAYELQCFGTGTQIATPYGAQRVETLMPGQEVRLADGTVARVRWVGWQEIDPHRAPVPERLEPIRVAAGAFGSGLPVRDLVLTADHAICLDGVLINAGALVNGTTVTRLPLAALPPGFRVYHVELPRHALLLAEGAACESFVDYAGRRGFQNGPDVLHQARAYRPIREMPLPRVTAQRQVPKAILARLRSHADLSL